MFNYKIQIVRLDDCNLNEISTTLIENRYDGMEALSIDAGTRGTILYFESEHLNKSCLALICFGNNSPYNTCETFDGAVAETTFSTAYSHSGGGLGFYQNKPATVGCGRNRNNSAETLTPFGWTPLPDHPL